MKELHVTKEELKRFPKANIHRVSESKLYYKGNHLFKVLNEELRDRKSTILRLEHLQGEELILPEYILIDEDGFIGYVMHYFKEHQHLENFIFGKLPFEERKRICLELCRIFTDLLHQDFAYFDFHPFNILYKDGDIKIGDLDSGIFRSNGIGSFLYEFEKFNSYSTSGNYHLALTILGLLFEDYQKFVLDGIKNNKKELFNNSPKELKKLYGYILYAPPVEFDIASAIENISEDYIEETKLILKK